MVFLVNLVSILAIEGDKQDHSVIKADKVVIALGPWTANVGSWFPRTAGSKPFATFNTERAHSVVIQSDSMPPAEAVFIDGGAGEGDGEVEIYPRPGMLPVVNTHLKKIQIF